MYVSGYHPRLGTPVVVRGFATRYFEIPVPYPILWTLLAFPPLGHTFLMIRRLKKEARGFPMEQS
jgi:hypothetical protein